MIHCSTGLYVADIQEKNPAEDRHTQMPANTMNLFLPTTGFLDTKITPAINQKNNGKSIYSKYQLNGRDLR